jgi:hypothetical protein
MRSRSNGRSWSESDPRWRTIYRWMWIWSPEDCAQCVALAHLMCGRGAAQGAVEEAVRYLLRQLRREVWDIMPGRSPKRPRALKPSRVARRSGYRTWKSRKNNAPHSAQYQTHPRRSGAMET